MFLHEVKHTMKAYYKSILWNNIIVHIRYQGAISDTSTISAQYLNRGGGSALLFWEPRFWDMSWRGRSGHIPTFWGWFWVHARNAAHVRPRSKIVAKNQNLKQRRLSFDFVAIRFVSKNKHFQKNNVKIESKPLWCSDWRSQQMRK